MVFCTFSVFFTFSILENEKENVRRTQRGRITIDGICAYKYALNPMLRKQVDVGGCMLASAVKWQAPHVLCECLNQEENADTSYRRINRIISHA